MTHNLKTAHFKTNITPNYPICLADTCFNSLLKASVILESLAPGRKLKRKESSAL